MAGQVSLFGDEHEQVATPRKRSVSPWSDREKMSYEKELLGFYVTGHPLDAYAEVIASGKYQTIASLTELSDHATFRVAGAITQVDKKFTRKEGKPFAIVWIEDLTATLEVVVWNDVYVKVSDVLVPGRVVEIEGTLDTRGDSLRGTAQKVKALSVEKPNGSANQRAATTFEEPAVLLQFSSATTREDLRQVREILTSSPGPRPVQLIFDRATIKAASDLSVDLTRELEEKLSRWLVTTKSDRRNVPVNPTSA